MNDRTLHTILDSFQKPELQDLGNILGNSLSPRLRKSQLVDQMHSYLRGEPRRWMSHLMERDVRLLQELVHAGPDKIQYQEFADYPSLLEVAGLVSYDDSDDNYHKVWISREVYDIVAPEVNHVLSAGEESGQFEVERIGLGYLNLYGILPTERFVDLVMNWFEHKHGSDFHRLSRFLQQSPLIKMYRYTDNHGDYICSPCVSEMDVDTIYYLREEFRQNRFKEFTFEEAMEAGAGAPYFNLGLKTPQGIRAEQMFRHLGYSGLDLVMVMHDTWVEAQHTAETNDRLMDPIWECPNRVLDDFGYLECIRILCDYANSLPKWVLNGQSADETGLCRQEWTEWESSRPKTDFAAEEAGSEPEYPQWSLPEPTVSDGFAADAVAEEYPMGFAIPHVAPDDPCPCGSGLRYCRCHGKYLS